MRLSYSAALLAGALSRTSDAFLAPKKMHLAFIGPHGGGGDASCETSSSSSSYTSSGPSCSNRQQQQQQQHQRRSHKSPALRVGNLGWDNEDFLEALSKGPDALDQANEQYKRTSRYDESLDVYDPNNPDGTSASIPAAAAAAEDDELPSDGGTVGAKLTKEQVEQIKKANEETGGGGAMYKKLLERAQDGPQKPPPQLAQPVVPPPPPPPPASAATPATASTPALPAGFENLSVEAQAALFRELMQSPAQPQQPQTFPGPPPGPRPEAKGQAPIAADGRRIGRNRDADAIVNTSDVYFAQLKLDSSTRNLARYDGQDDVANAVWSADGIRDIKLHVNPHMEEARRKEQAMLETAAEEMITPDMFVDEAPVDMSDAGISYKDKLRQRRSGGDSASSAAKRASSASSTAAATPAAVSVPPPPADAKAAAPVVPTPVPAPTPMAVAPPPAPLTTPSTSAPAATTTTAAPLAPDQVRRRIRTLMGSLLKHRGGPGFGSGRLQGQEVQLFENLAVQVTATLRDELTSSSSSVATAPVSSPPVATAPAADGSPTRIDNMIACIEGALLMYKNSPPELQPSVLVTLRAALLSAVGTANEILASTGDTAPVPAAPPSSSSNDSERIASMVACIEGAILMYKNSPPALQQSVLGTLRAALLSAVGTVNAIVETVDTTINTNSVATASTPMATTTLPVQSSTTSSAPPEYSGRDENSLALEGIYEKLKGVAGEGGAMGLKKDMSAAEAQDLADEIVRMRSMLVDELSSGIVPDDATSSKASAAAPASGGSSKYQEMLAKARAAKE